MLPGRTAAAISSSSGTNSAGGSPANSPGSVGSNKWSAAENSAVAPRLGAAPPPRAATPSSRRRCQPGSASRRARDGGGRAPARRCRPRRDRRHAPARDRARRSAPRGSSRSQQGRNPRARPTSDPPRLVPRDDGELVRQGDELWPPHAGIHRSAVHEHERRPFADALVGDLEPVRPTDLHHLNLHTGVTKRRTQSEGERTRRPESVARGLTRCDLRPCDERRAARRRGDRGPPSRRSGRCRPRSRK